MLEREDCNFGADLNDEFEFGRRKASQKAFLRDRLWDSDGQGKKRMWSKGGGQTHTPAVEKQNKDISPYVISSDYNSKQFTRL